MKKIEQTFTYPSLALPEIYVNYADKVDGLDASAFVTASHAASMRYK